jgi:glycosyltransferase involved in cell wall biosynthesis
MRGGEVVLEALLEMYPEADIFTHVYDQKNVSAKINSRKIVTTFINKLPWAKKFYQIYLPLMPLALEQLDLTDYDLVISAEAGPAKGIITAPEAVHICYCHSPMRYVWDLTWQYQNKTNAVVRFLLAPVLHYLRSWDQISASRPSVIVANSSFTQKRIAQYWGQESTVIHPPVSVIASDFLVTATDYYVYAGALVNYKSAELAVAAFNANGKVLLVLGGGEERSRLEESANTNIRFLGRLADDQFSAYIAEAKALIFPGLEDFGITPVEAICLKTPVIAYGRGGVLDSVTDGITGVLFREQTVASLQQALAQFESMSLTISDEQCEAIKQQFSPARFEQQFSALLAAQLQLS